jgi:hypothetical protein
MVGDDGMTMVFAILCVSHRGKDTIMSSVLGSGTAVRHFHRFASKGERFHPSWFHAAWDWMPPRTVFIVRETRTHAFSLTGALT